MDTYVSYMSYAQLVEYYSQYFRDSGALASESWSFTPYMSSEYLGPQMGPLSSYGPPGPLTGPLPANGPLSFASGALTSGAWPPQAYQPLPSWTSGAPSSSGPLGPLSGPLPYQPLPSGPLRSSSGALGPLSSSESSPESSTPEPPTAWLRANWPTLWDPRKPCDHCGTPTLKLLKTTGTDKLLCRPCRQYRSIHKKMRPLVKKSS